MASFTDQISQFNPYIQQLPVEAMTQVGMFKQQKYDEGVQKIQGYIDNIAGLDVIRDVDKGYLQSKLDQLGNRLKTVAAGDFSNFQLVNSVGGMATQIVKDPFVQNAVASTSWYRKQSELMENAIKEGKSSQANIYDFNEKANAWMNSTDLGAKFRDRYTPYKDVKKTAMDAIKALHPKLREYDVPFETVNGKINTRKIADAMKRFKIEGIDENQIKQAIYASLTPDDVNQLQIDANYQFRDIDSNKLVNLAQIKYDAGVKDAKEKLDFLRMQKNITRPPEVLEMIDNRIEYYEKQLGKDGVKGLLNEEYEDEVSEAQNNPEKVRLSLYKDGFVKEFANAFSWKSESEQYVTNPIRQQLNWAADFAFEQRKASEEARRWNLKFDQDERKIALDAEANALKKAELYGVDGTWTPLTNETDRVVRAKEHFGNHVTNVKNSIDADMSALRKKYTDAEINGMLNDWEKNGTKATTVRPDALILVQKISKQNNYLESLRETDDRLKKQASDIVRQSGTFREKAQEMDAAVAELGKIPTAKAIVDWRTNETIPVSAPQLIKDIESGRASLSVDKAPAGKIRLSYNVNGAIKTVELDKRGIGADIVGGKELRPILLGVSDYMNKYGKAESEYKSAVDNEYKRLLAPRITTLVPEIKAIPRGKDGKVAPVLYDGISQLIYAAAEGKYQANEDYDQSVASSMLADENVKDTRIFVHRNGDKYELRINNATLGKPEQVIRLDANDVRSYIGPNYVSDKTQASIRMELGRGNTNLTGDPKRSEMQSRFGDFPGITKYDVTADLNQDLSNPDLYTYMINVRKKDGRYQNFEISGPNNLMRVGYDQGKKQLSAMLNDVSLMKLLKEEYPNFDYSQFDY